MKRRCVDLREATTASVACSALVLDGDAVLIFKYWEFDRTYVGKHDGIAAIVRYYPTYVYVVPNDALRDKFQEHHPTNFVPSHRRELIDLRT